MERYKYLFFSSFLSKNNIYKPTPDQIKAADYLESMAKPANKPASSSDALYCRDARS